MLKKRLALGLGFVLAYDAHIAVPIAEQSHRVKHADDYIGLQWSELKGPLDLGQSGGMRD